MRTAQVAVVFSLLLAVAATLLAQTASAPVYTTQTISLSGNIYDDCTGEFIDLTGTVTVNTASWSDSNGNSHLRTSTVWDESGVGETSGLNYTVNAQLAYVESIANNVQAQEQSVLFRAHVNGAGAAANEIQRSLFHITVNADGTTTSILDGPLTEICTGR